MKARLDKKRALSTVLTTVIILVASVAFGAGVVLYGASLFQGSTQTEAISVGQTKLWVHTTASDGLAWGAAAIRNAGDKVVSVDSIKVRGQTIPFTQWYPDTAVEPNLYQITLNHTGWTGTNGMLLEIDPDEICNDITFVPGSSIQIDSDGSGGELPICANSASGPVSLNPGQAAIIYFKLTNGTLSSLDSGASTTVSIFAGKAGGPQMITVGAK